MGSRQITHKKQLNISVLDYVRTVILSKNSPYHGQLNSFPQNFAAFGKAPPDFSQTFHERSQTMTDDINNDDKKATSPDTTPLAQHHEIPVIEPYNQNPDEALMRLRYEASIDALRVHLFGFVGPQTLGLAAVAHDIKRIVKQLSLIHISSPRD